MNAIAQAIPLPQGSPISEVEICRFGAHTIVGLPYADPILRATADNLDGERYYRLASLMRQDAVREALRGYFATYSAYKVRDDLPFSTPWRQTAQDITARLAKEIKRGTIVVRGPEIRGVTVSDLGALTPAGWRFVYTQETQEGVSEKLHWPGGSSGVTLGAGYDMKGRSAEEIISDLLAIQVDEKTAKAVGDASTRVGARARDFVANNQDLITLTQEQQENLYSRCLPNYISHARAQIPILLKLQPLPYEFDTIISYVYNAWSLRADFLVALNSRDFRNPTLFRNGPNQSRITKETTLFTQGVYLL